VQASLQSNTYVISGAGETKPLQDLFPGILNQMGPENMNALRQLMGAMMQGNAAAGAAAGAAPEDEEIPDLVESFEEAANK
jgi:nascent polypeptide-associated complex subunit beta